MSVVIIAALLLVMCGFFVWLDFSVRRTIERELQTLAAFACPACGAAYGMEAAERARREHLEFCGAEQKRQPHFRINFARVWEVECSGCGSKAWFHYEKGRLTPPEEYE